MQKLVKGIHSFQRGFFASHRELFKQLAEAGQQPETLFITCSDSRVDPNLITNSQPGELFIVRNVGNVVPTRDLPGGTAAAIQYAVEVLNVQNIILCGHTQCGALKAILDPDSVTHLEYVSRWVKSTISVKNVIEEKYAHLEGEAKLTAAIQENVLAQLEHLREYPFVAERMDAGKLHVNGWIFDVGRGEVFDYDPEYGEFLSLSKL
ncbi:MAG TPA: carbonic anhydrase [Polyangiaceae bacterium]|nr:carbonic anhydrase [Polyangiaceae bacterium]